MAKHKLPEEVGPRLVGTTEAELDADAANLAKLLKPQTAANTEAGAGQNNRQAGQGANQQTSGGQGQQKPRPYVFQQPGDKTW